MGAQFVLWLTGLRNELMLFAGFGFALGGIDDLAIDLVWIAGWLGGLGRPAVAKIKSIKDVPPAFTSGRVAVFIPAWQEQAVIGDMLRHALAAWPKGDFDMFVGCYPNDPETLAAVTAISDRRVRGVLSKSPGPTTKADCLNTIYAAMKAAEETTGIRYKAVLLHDAEDLVHPDELTLCDRLIDQLALLQLPVLPLQTKGSPWISGHYLDEFAQAHSRDMIVRGALGAAIPSAGVGCALHREALHYMEMISEGRPFSDGSLTEDYELGLRLADTGAPIAFVRIKASARKGLVATRAHFPNTLSAAVRQKARWTIGIALAGWDRMGWKSDLLENWMRLRDRRAPYAALALLSGYTAAILSACIYVAAPAAPPLPRAITGLLMLTGIMLVWRLCIRSLCVGHHYGWKAALISVPRAITSNFVSMLAAARAIFVYTNMRRTGTVIWDKTTHRSPLDP